MPEPGSRKPASDLSEAINLSDLRKEGLHTGRDTAAMSSALRRELAEKGLKGFKRGGKVKKTGLAKVHKGERVLKASTARKVTPAKIAAAARKKPAPRRRAR